MTTTGRTRRVGVFDLSDRASSAMRRAAFVVGSLAIAVLGAFALTGELPRNPEGDWLRPLEVPLQLGLLAVAGIGLAVAIRFPAPGATLLALCGVALGAMSAIENTPTVALAVTVAFVGPAVLLWSAWQRHETPVRILALAATTSGLILGGWLAAGAVHDHFFGPAHPESTTPSLDDPLVEWAWAGAVRPDGFTVVVQPRDDARSVAVEVRSASGAPHRTPASPVVDGVARVRVDGVAPATDVDYRVVVDGDVAPEWTGQLRTFPEAGEPTSLRLAFSSCARTGSNGRVFDAIRAADPDLYVITGDLHYANIDRDAPEAFARAYDAVLTAPAQAALYRSVPIAYVWDDHDYSGNDGDASAPSRDAARAAYERAVPHADLVDPTTINQAFSIGSVRVVMLDTRSARVPGDTMLGASQLDWLRDELVTSSASHDLVILVSPTPWIGAPSASSDAWAGFAEERATIADVIAEHGIDDLVVVGGDAHMVAIDDGTNSDYARSGSAPVPVLQAAALDRPGSVKGGPFSEGTFPGAGQFGLIDVEPVDDGIRVRLSGWTWDGTELVHHEFVVPAG